MSLEIWIACVFLAVLTMCIFLDEFADFKRWHSVLYNVQAVCLGICAALFISAATNSFITAGTVGVILLFFFWYTKQSG
ncbi:hypothetical protein ACFP1I_32005 [Dyadobacter subterraneus]|uniref:Uncharacterized protein n=1 Tax=Dyadobacter subterraneus TaxID=2773304 RepID=A0ABR9W928_9BACT|nr:hypothetical protein [Dyadobacter subterraneus]MBE9461960.1 hypothetical protein [Dyadobacter subterraneus]